MTDPHTCLCGCGTPTRIATRNRYDLGHVKGEPIPYANGHNRSGKRSRNWTEEDRGFTSACWIWGGYIQSNGYGKATGENGMDYAHRVVYRELVGPIPERMSLDHLCRVRCCVNPAHLEPVTQAENLRRGRLARKE